MTVTSSRGAVRAAALAALGIAVLVVLAYTLATLPQKAISLGTVPDTVVYGAYHVHSSRSDGTGTVDEIAAAAGRAGLRFVVITDHGDGTRPPLPAQYLHGVLCLDAVELNSQAGHVVALGLRSASPYPIAGEADGVIEDIHRQSGWAVIAHPDSPRQALAWHDWSVPYDGIEWLNADAEWRARTPLSLVGAAAQYVFRSPESIAMLFQRPHVTLRRWDDALRTRPVVGLAGLDAHARLFGGPDAGSGQAASYWSLRAPSYTAMFRALAQAVVLEAPLTGGAEADAARVLQALRAGRTFSIIRGMASPASLEFSATSRGVTVPMGGVVPAGAPAVFRARVPEAPGSNLVLVCNGLALTTGRGSVSYSIAGDPTACRVEVFLPGRSMPWIVSNAISLAEATSAAPPVQLSAAVETMSLLDASRWVIERDATSTGSIAASGGISFSFALGTGRPAGQYAAISTALGGTRAYDRVELEARADAPMRVWLQVRLPGGKDGLRWERSFYIDQTPRRVVVPLGEFSPVDQPSTSRPIAARLQSLLIVVDTVNSLPGKRGTITLSAVAVSRGGGTAPAGGGHP